MIIRVDSDVEGKQLIDHYKSINNYNVPLVQETKNPRCTYQHTLLRAKVNKWAENVPDRNVSGQGCQH